MQSDIFIKGQFRKFFGMYMGSDNKNKVLKCGLGCTAMSVCGRCNHECPKQLTTAGKVECGAGNGAVYYLSTNYY